MWLPAFHVSIYHLVCRQTENMRWGRIVQTRLHRWRILAVPRGRLRTESTHLLPQHDVTSHGIRHADECERRGLLESAEPGMWRAGCGDWHRELGEQQLLQDTSGRGGGCSFFSPTAECMTSCTTDVIVYIENTTRVPVGDDLSYNEWFPRRI